MVLYNRRRPVAMTERAIPNLITVSEYARLGNNGTDPETAEKKVAISSAMDLIASLASELGVTVYRGERSGPNRLALPMPAWLADPGGEGYGLPDWIYQLVISWLSRGNAFGEIVTVSDRGNFPTGIQLYPPTKVKPEMGPAGLRWKMCDDESYSPADPTNYRPDTVIHTRVNPRPGCLLGQSMLEKHMPLTIGQALDAAEYGAGWFAGGGHPSAILSNSEVDLKEGDGVAARVKSKFLAAMRNGKREPLVLGKGWTYDTIQLTPEESQFLATQALTNAECARIFGPGMAEILGYETGSSLTYSTVQGRLGHLLTLSVEKWLSRVERVLSIMVPRGQFVEIDRNAILRSATLERYQAYHLQLADGWFTPNEVRQRENLPDIVGGDELKAVGSTPADPMATPADPGSGTQPMNSGG